MCSVWALLYERLDVGRVVCKNAAAVLLLNVFTYARYNNYLFLDTNCVEYFQNREAHVYS